MKTLLITLFLAFTLVPSVAQDQTDSNKHLTFKGVPIDGTLDEFVLEIKKSGFIQISKEEGFAMLKGDFAGYKGCVIGVSTLKGKDLVSRISVIFPEKGRWSSLSSDYFTLKDMLTEKYGEPSEIVEEFQTSYTPDDDNSKMYEVSMNRCNYYSTYELENGIIQLSIENGDFGKGYIMLSYFDRVNSQKIRNKAIDDL